VGRLTTPTLARPGPADPRQAVRRTPAPSRARAFRDFQVPLRIVAALATFYTALCLGNLFNGISWWLWPCAGAIVVAAFVGELGQRLRIPAAAMPLLFVVFGWIYVIPAAARGSADLAGAKLIPSGATFDALRALVDSATTDIRSLTVPVPERPGFLLLTVAGVFLIAALVDYIAIWLTAPAVAGIPLLALLAVPAALATRGVGLLAFIASCVSYLLLLFLSGRRGMARWARLPAAAAPRFRRVTGASGRRIGAVALVAALAVPLLVPRYGGFAHHHGGAGGGSATVIEPVVTLAQQLHQQNEEPLLTVRTNNPEYLRLTALEYFDGKRFTLGSLSAGSKARVSRGLPKVTGGTSIQVKQTITVEPTLKQRYLPLAYQPTAIVVSGDWRLSSRTFTIFSAKTDTSGATYTVTSQVATPSVDELRKQSAGDLPSNVSPDIELPSGLPVEIARLTTKLTAGLTTEYDKAAAIQSYFRGPDYTYDLTGAPTGDDALLKFLTTDKRGYCEQFASAMVVLARQAGIPARVAVGFTPGVQQADGSWLVTNHDAHSWPEVWFPQAGWVRFEPTPRDASTSPPAYTTAPVDPKVTPAPSASATASASSTPSAAPTSAAASHSKGPTTPVTTNGGSSSSGLGAILAWGLGTLAVVGLLLVPAGIRLSRRRRRLEAASSGDPQQAWREIVDTALDLGLDLAATLSPQRAVERLRATASGNHVMPQVSYDVFSGVARAEQLWRYAPAGDPAASDPTAGGCDLPDLASRMRVALGAWERSQGRRARLAALLLPRSLAAGLRGTGGGFSSDDSVDTSAAH
jgi:transglutaminase-like putative cysteine protease